MKFEIFNNENYVNIAKNTKTSSLVAKVIEAYNIQLDKDLTLKNPYDYNSMQDVVGYLLKAINEKKKIMVYGDYDVDGICSVSILKRMFSLLNTNIGYYIPSRYKDGYGLNTAMVEEIANKKYDIIICIDNGINANDAIDLANKKGIEVIVLDHHELNGDTPKCKYFLHPKLSNFVDYNMCASSVAYYLSLALLGENDEKCAILAGIATLSDIMPLVEQNKLLLRNAITLLNKHKYKNLDILIDNNEYNENTLSMTLIPKLNSVGRIIKDIKVNSVISFLFEEDEKKMLEYAKYILNCNETRKQISNDFFNMVSNDISENAIVVKNDSLLEGVCGIIASRLANTYDAPSFVFAKSEDGNYYKGSARSNDGYDLVAILSKMDYLVNFGGHNKAAGITIKIDDFTKFKNDVNDIVSSLEKVETITKVISVNEDELTYKNYQELLKYGPFGEANPYPIFIMKNIDKSLVTFSKDKKHLLIKLNNEITFLGFNLANKYEEKYNNYEVIFTLDKNNLIKNKLSCKCLEINGGY